MIVCGACESNQGKDKGDAEGIWKKIPSKLTRVMILRGPWSIEWTMQISGTGELLKKNSENECTSSLFVKGVEGVCWNDKGVKLYKTLRDCFREIQSDHWENNLDRSTGHIYMQMPV